MSDLLFVKGNRRRHHSLFYSVPLPITTAAISHNNIIHPTPLLPSSSWRLGPWKPLNLHPSSYSSSSNSCWTSPPIRRSAAFFQRHRYYDAPFCSILLDSCFRSAKPCSLLPSSSSSSSSSACPFFFASNSRCNVNAAACCGHCSRFAAKPAAFTKKLLSSTSDSNSTSTNDLIRDFDSKAENSNSNSKNSNWRKNSNSNWGKNSNSNWRKNSNSNSNWDHSYSCCNHYRSPRTCDAFASSTTMKKEEEGHYCKVSKCDMGVRTTTGYYKTEGDDPWKMPQKLRASCGADDKDQGNGYLMETTRKKQREMMKQREVTRRAWSQRLTVIPVLSFSSSSSSAVPRRRRCEERLSRKSTGGWSKRYQSLLHNSHCPASNLQHRRQISSNLPATTAASESAEIRRVHHDFSCLSSRSALAAAAGDWPAGSESDEIRRHHHHNISCLSSRSALAATAGDYCRQHHLIARNSTAPESSHQSSPPSMKPLIPPSSSPLFDHASTTKSLFNNVDDASTCYDRRLNTENVGHFNLAKPNIHSTAALLRQLQFHEQQLQSMQQQYYYY